jgi:signal transduction histidine kinase
VTIPDYRQAGVIQGIYEIVKAHAGKIKVNRQQNIGTGFTIILPITG